MLKLNNNLYDIRKHDVSLAFDAAAKKYDRASMLQKTIVERLIESFDFKTGTTALFFFRLLIRFFKSFIEKSGRAAS